MAIIYNDKQPLLFHFFQLMRHQMILHEFNDIVLSAVSQVETCSIFSLGVGFMNKEKMGLLCLHSSPQCVLSSLETQ
jgi:hypothetical protein